MQLSFGVIIVLYTGENAHITSNFGKKTVGFFTHTVQGLDRWIFFLKKSQFFLQGQTFKNIAFQNVWLFKNVRKKIQRVRPPCRYFQK